MSKLNYIRQNGIKKSIQKAIRKTAGINSEKQQEEIDTLYYYLNNFTDITKLKAPTKDLQDLQEGGVELLRIFHNACEKYGLTYWLDYGTLLGAIRNHNFIPWDDDMDIAMPREDYVKVLPLMQKEMAQYGIKLDAGGHFDDRRSLARLGFEYKALETGIWMDIFPVDHISSKYSVRKVAPAIHDANRKFRRYYKRNEHRASDEEINMKKKELFAGIPQGKHEIYFHGQEFLNNKDYLYKKTDIYPLKKVPFGRYEFFVPNHSDTYLIARYGEGYMQYPRGGVEHHTDPDGQTASTRARRTGTNMSEVIRYLRKIGDEIRR